MAKKRQTQKRAESIPEKFPDNPMQALMRWIWSLKLLYRMLALVVIVIIGAFSFTWTSLPESSKEEVINYLLNKVGRDSVKEDSVSTIKRQEKAIIDPTIALDSAPPIESNKNVADVRQNIKSTISEDTKKNKNLGIPSESTNDLEVAKKIEGLHDTLGNQINQQAFMEASNTVASILRLDPDDSQAHITQALIDKRNGIGVIHQFHGPGRTLSADFSPDGNRILTAFNGVIGGDSPAFIVWDIASRNAIRKFKTPDAHCIAFSRDRKLALFSPVLGKDILWDIEKRREVRILDRRGGYVNSSAFSPDGRYAITGGKDNIVRLYHLEIGALMRSFEGHMGDIESLAVSPDGRHIVSGSADTTICLWSLVNAEKIWCVEGYEDRFQSIAISDDGQHIVAGGETIRLMDIQNGREIRSFKGHKGYVLSLAFSPDGRRVLSGGDDGTVRLWDVEDGREIRRFEVSGFWLRTLAFSPDGRHAVAGDMGIVHLLALPQ